MLERCVTQFGPESRSQGSGLCVVGRRWVGEMSSRVAGCARHLEKSALSFMNRSIHRLPYWQVNIPAFGASSLKERSS
jgi:hypothetical protein